MEEGKDMERSVPRDDGKKMRSLNTRLESWIARNRLEDDRVKRANQAEVELRQRLGEEKKRACAEIQTLLDQERANVQKLSTAYNDVTHQLNVKRESMNSLKLDLTDKEKECDALKEQLENVTSDLTSEKTEQGATREAHTKVSRLLKDSEAKNRKLEESLVSVRKERSQLKTEKARIESMHGLSADDLKKMRGKWMDEVNRLKNQVKALKLKNDGLSKIFLEKFNRQLTEQTLEIERQKSEAYAQELRTKEAFYDKRVTELQQQGEHTANELQETKTELLELERLLAERDRFVRELEEKSSSIVEERRRFDKERKILLLQVSRLKGYYVALEKEYNELKKNKLEFVAAIGNTRALLDDEDRRIRESGELDPVDEDDLAKFADAEIEALQLHTNRGNKVPSAFGGNGEPAEDEGKEARGRKEGEEGKSSPSRRRASRRRSTRTTKAAATDEEVVPSRKRKRTASTTSSKSTSTTSTTVTTRQSTRSGQITNSTSSSSQESEKAKEPGKRKASALDPPTPKAAPESQKADEPKGQPEGGDERKPKANGVPSREVTPSPPLEPASKRQRTDADASTVSPLVVRFDDASRAIVAKNVSSEPVSLNNYRLSVGSKMVRLQRERVLPPGGECYFFASLQDCDKYGKGKKLKVAFGENNMKFTAGIQSSICLESPEGVMTMIEDSHQNSGCFIM